MAQALDQARAAFEEGEVPVGAVIVHGGRIIAEAHNQREALNDPTAHAEMIAITQAAQSLESWRLLECVLYVTLEPCPMCAGAIVQARIPTVVFGAADPKAGACQSLKKFDPEKGVKFISYAVWWIRQTVLQALAEQTRSVRIPLNQNSNLVKLSRTETALTQKLGRSPTDREIADEMKEPVETVRALRRVASAELSLDAPLDKSDRDSASFGERFSGADEGDIEVDVEAQARREFLERMFESYLTERERKILVLYYGLDDGEEMTLEQIGELLGVTRERIRQIRNRAFDKLKNSLDGDALEGFWRASA
jgi:RNA polymerase primary sigma factor